MNRMLSFTCALIACALLFSFVSAETLSGEGTLTLNITIDAAVIDAPIVESGAAESEESDEEPPGEESQETADETAEEGTNETPDELLDETPSEPAPEIRVPLEISAIDFPTAAYRWNKDDSVWSIEGDATYFTTTVSITSLGEVSAQLVITLGDYHENWIEVIEIISSPDTIEPGETVVIELKLTAIDNLPREALTADNSGGMLNINAIATAVTPPSDAPDEDAPSPEEPLPEEDT